MIFGRDELCGIDEIRKYLGLEYNLTVLDWRIGYDLPIKKESGIWKGRCSELKKWKKEHEYLSEILPEQRETINMEIVKGRWGSLKIQKIRR